MKVAATVYPGVLGCRTAMRAADQQGRSRNRAFNHRVVNRSGVDVSGMHAQ